MATGISLHIGINQYDQSHYEGLSDLFACENDAVSMHDIAQQKGFTSQVLRSNEATSSAVKTAILKAAEELESGDIFWISYAGHGGQTIDHNGDEDDFMDETWCLFDRQLLDDELYFLWSQFKEGVRVLIVSDSCHSGTVSRSSRSDSPFLSLAEVEAPKETIFLQGFESERYRNVPQAIAAKIAQKHSQTYLEVSNNTPQTHRGDCLANVQLLAACQDHQQALDGLVNGFFTAHIMRLLKDGGGSLSYSDFIQKLASRMPDNQHPNHDSFGGFDSLFQNQTVFEINPTEISPTISQNDSDNQTTNENDVSLRGSSQDSRDTNHFNLDALSQGDLSWFNSRSLALACKAVYEKQDDVLLKTLNKWGFTNNLLISEPKHDVQLFIASSDKVIVVCFRGTESKKDWIVNLNAAGKERDYGKVHKGFYEAFESVESQIDTFIEQQVHLQDKKLFICGHSLGGALALMMTAEMAFNDKLYHKQFSGLATYGQPLLGNKKFKNSVLSSFSSQYARFANTGDIVTNIPPNYVHASQAIKFDRDGDLINTRSQSMAETDLPLTEEEFEILQSELNTDKDPNTIGTRGNFWFLNQHSMDRYLSNIHKVIQN